jgi:lycopene beta-cyclase
MLPQIPLNATENNFDYIIAGGGMAGLSLAYRLVNSALSYKKILIIDLAPKTKNDRTWCFWEHSPGPFEQIVCNQWNEVYFGNIKGELRPLDIRPYKYKMLRGIDFYEFVYSQLAKHSNVHCFYDSIEDISQTDLKVTVSTKTKVFTASFVFDSATKLQLMAAIEPSSLVNEGKGKLNLYQHFMGFVIETPQPSFDVNKPQLMNFGIAQHNECRFMYVLPLSNQRALVEFTVFSDATLTKDQYHIQLTEFISNNITKQHYEILEEEFGVIPMTNEPTTARIGKRIIRIGTAGGATHPATGYTFANTQKQLHSIVNKLSNTGIPFQSTSFWYKRHAFYASILLYVLQNKKYAAAQFFDELYQKNSPAKIQKFLDSETNLFEEIKIMSSTPIAVFVKATFSVLSLFFKRQKI